MSASTHSSAAKGDMPNPRRIARLVAHDVRLQFRYGIHVAYAFVVLFYVVSLRLGEGYVPEWLKVLVLFTDPSVLGFFFLGSLMMLERAENTRTAIAMTPTSASEYLASKVISLTGLALVAVAALTPFLHTSEAGAPPNWPLLLVSVALTSMSFVGLGVVAASYFETVSSYLMGAALWLVPVIAPGFVVLTGAVSTGVLSFPAASQVSLLRVGLGDLSASPLQLSVMLGVSAIAAVMGFGLGVRTLRKELAK